MTEEAISHYVDGGVGKADIIISLQKSDRILPAIVVECKEPSKLLTDTAKEQGLGYALSIGAEYVFLSNGYDLNAYKIDDVSRKPQMLEWVPSYADLLSSTWIPFVKSEPSKPRVSLEMLNDEHYLESYWSSIYGGVHTPYNLRAPVANLYDALMDTSHKLPLMRRGNVDVLEDNGLSYRSNMNRSGEGYDGWYRSFLVKLGRGNTSVVSISIFGIDPDFENRGRGYTSLIVSVNVKTSTHNILQLNVDDFCAVEDGKFVVKHNGRISSVRSDKLMAYVSRRKPAFSFINTSSILLGSVPINKLMYIDDPEVTELVYNLMEYGLLRQAFRDLIRRKSSGKTSSTKQ